MVLVSVARHSSQCLRSARLAPGFRNGEAGSSSSFISEFFLAFLFWSSQSSRSEQSPKRSSKVFFSDLGTAAGVSSRVSSVG